MGKPIENSQWKLKSPVGDLFIVASEHAVHGVYWRKQAEPPIRSTRLIQQCVSQLEEYFAGARKNFDLPMEFQGTDFQKQVWEELLKIPYGETCSYAELAKRVRRPKAFRAAGTANGKNPIAIIIPCHRVIATGGGLGGYAGGLSAKEKLLKIERAN